MHNDGTTGGGDLARLQGYLDLGAFLAACEPIRRGAAATPGRHFAIDFTGATGFSGPAVAALAELILEVRALGSDLSLINLSPPIYQAMVDRLVETYLYPAMEGLNKQLQQSLRGRPRSRDWSASVN